MKDISPQQWSEIEPILDEALEADPSDRLEIVERLCGDNADLKSSVLSLLKAGDKAVDFLERPQQEQFEKALANMAADEEEEGEDPYINRTVGPYQLVRRLGRGGMGQVYLGSRVDDAFDKFVAVKIIRRGMDTEEILQRFRTERRILASLVHPNIARLLDGGSTADGLSYFVMDYVDGTTITEYADTNRLSVRARLELFKRVCSAVHYAHQNLIVHRDLKPSNILVDDEGEVKLLDFGIAKFLHPEETDFTVPVTRDEVRIMTPEYASPEQARGEAITTASDVYQLGILLYELLTGGRPYDFSNERRKEIERIICETEPERPSTAISSVSVEGAETGDVGEKRNTPIERLRKQLSGDLDRIVLMALRKEADRRYQSADQFLEDINRYLAGLPVHAQSDTWIYRAGKFVGRHRIGVATTTAVGVLLVLTATLALQSAITTARQNREIQLALEKKEQVTDLMIGMFEASDPANARGQDLTASELLASSTERIERELADQPDVQAEMFHTIGSVYLQLGMLEESGPLLERALLMRRELYGEEDSGELAQSLFDMARWYTERGDAEQQAEALHQESLAMRRRLFTEPDASIAQSMHELGALYYELTGNYDEAEQLFRSALAMRLELEGPESRGISETMVNLASLLSDMGDYERAEPYYRPALAMQRKLLGDDHPFVASTLYNFGALLFDVGSDEEAERLLRECQDLRIVLYGADHREVAIAQTKLGQILHRRGNLVDAETSLRAAYNTLLRILGPNHARTGRAMQLLGLVRHARGDTDEAISLLAGAVNSFQAFFANGHPLTAEAQSGLASIRLERNELGEAENLLRPALALYIESFTEASPQAAGAQLLLGKCLTRSGATGEATELILKSVAFYEAAGDGYSNELADARSAQAELIRVSDS